MDNRIIPVFFDCVIVKTGLQCKSKLNKGSRDMKNLDMPTLPNGMLTASPCTSQRSANAFGGLTKREHFAAMALQGLLAGGCISIQEAAMGAVEVADLLLAELEEGAE